MGHAHSGPGGAQSAAPQRQAIKSVLLQHGAASIAARRYLERTAGASVAVAARSPAADAVSPAFPTREVKKNEEGKKKNSCPFEMRQSCSCNKPTIC